MTDAKNNDAYLRLPATAHFGEIISVQVKIKQAPKVDWHRGDHALITNPENSVQIMRCLFNGRELLRADIGEGLAADPYFSFNLRLKESGTLEVQWESANKIIAKTSGVITVT